MKKNAIGTHRQTLQQDEHQPWCDHRQHALADEYGVSAQHCVGRIIQTAPEVAGWWMVDERVGDFPRFYVDSTSWHATKHGLRAVQMLLQAGHGAELLELVTKALADFEDGIPAGEQA